MLINNGSFKDIEERVLLEYRHSKDIDWVSFMGNQNMCYFLKIEPKIVRLNFINKYTCVNSFRK